MTLVKTDLVSNVACPFCHKTELSTHVEFETMQLIKVCKTCGCIWYVTRLIDIKGQPVEVDDFLKSKNMS